MNLIRREPTLPYFPRLETPFYREMENMSDRINKFFGTWTRPYEVTESLKVADWAPAVDIQETEKEYLLKLEIPEVKKEDVKVTIAENELTITGERKLEKEEKEENFHRVERRYGSFIRAFTLPNTVDPESAKANYDKGVLKLTFAKRAEAKPKQIKIGVGSEQQKTVEGKGAGKAA